MKQNEMLSEIGMLAGKSRRIGRITMQNERIEILMAAYNGAPYIREQVDSILRQSDANWHLTLSDDGSTDGTDAI